MDSSGKELGCRRKEHDELARPNAANAPIIDSMERQDYAVRSGAEVTGLKCSQ